ncbi:MAG: cytochrome c biogenesis CcdA family protein [Dehalococcoidales bacterium]
MTEQIPLLVAFAAGLASFLSPCVLPLVPVYLASLAGPEIFEPEARRVRMPIFLHSLSFVIGFSIVFSLWGAGVGLIGSAFVTYSYVIRQIAGSLLIVFGLFMLAAQRVPWLNFEKRLTPSRSATTGYLRSILTGGVFSLAWTPCVGPILGGILALALGSETGWHGAYLLTVFSLGLGLPFLIVGAAFDSVIPLLKRIHRYSTAIYVISGVLLIAVGILTLTNRLIWL